MKKSQLIIIFSFLLLSCSNGDDGPPSPAAASLISPENNSECTTGTDVNDSQSSVTFHWNAANNTDSYEITITNLITNSSVNLKSSATSVETVLDKSVPYSWFVTSIGSSNQTAQSETWKFMNAGGTISYAPFPADLISPASEAVITGASVNFSWEGSDVDNDIVGYDLLLDTTNPPSNVVMSDITEQSVSVSSLTAGVYYWRVITSDEEGNASKSVIYQFEKQ
ncbi:hypothetical protein [Abyssalbus ytuae]|uniref:Fibronectin type-III domain-containing protein n=1 Tax=Abyssalbus ytuae TaxID=2926907 RepID=A0A9E7CSF4_9FLAO|nr:hypothetical protein [Abyssalbus ytuae]UOB16196.1 hypothetical protein MQE35_10655 [Abyssalbus ytuae]